MSYKTRSARRLARKSRRNFLISLILIGIILFATVNWLLPNFISGVGFIKNILRPSKKTVSDNQITQTMAPPVFSIPYEATNTARIDIRGYGTPNSKVALFMDDQKKDTVDVSDDGSFEFKNVQLVLGTNNIYGKSIGDNNQESLPSKTIQLIYLSQNPPLSLNEPDDNKKIQGGDKKVHVSGKTAADIKVYVNDNLVIVDKDGNFSTDALINDGDNTITVKAVDLAGNQTETQRHVTYSSS